ncbi:MAG TPA: ABC transporter substrate-binding protein [Lachnospiraceae bacterium]|nr:ABC transporter substrate-binding protein [Lachnospiraceae bacterium]
MKKGIISILLSTVMAAGMLTGCGSAAGTASDTGSAASASQSTLSDSGEVKTISMYTMGIGTTTDYAAVEDAINAISEPAIGVKVKWTVLDIGQWFEQYNLLLSGSESVDLMPNMGGVATGAEQGAFMELDDLYAKYGQDIAKYYDESFLKAGYVGDHLYGISSQKDFAATKNITYRSDIVKELGIDVSNVKTLADWEPIMAAVKEKYPEMAGFVSNSGSSLNQFDTFDWDTLGDGLGVLMNYGNDTTVTNLYESDEYANILHTMREWFEKGYTAQDTATSTEAAGDLIGAGKAFSTITTGNPGTEAEYTVNTGYPMATIPLTDAISTTGNITALMWSIPASSAEPEAAMKFLNLMYSNSKIMDLLNYGIEGTNYKVTDSGTYDYADGQDASSCTYHPQMTWIWPNSYIGGEWEGSEPDLGTKMSDFNKNATKSKALGFTFDKTNVVNETTACSNVVKQYAYGLEVGAVDIDTVLPEFQQALKDAGIDKIIAEKQTQLDAWLAAQK